MVTALHNYFNPPPSQEEEASEEEMDEVVISQVEGRTSEGEGNQDDKDIDLEINREAEVTKESNGAMLAKGKRKMRSNGKQKKEKRTIGSDGAGPSGRQTNAPQQQQEQPYSIRSEDMTLMIESTLIKMLPTIAYAVQHFSKVDGGNKETSEDKTEELRARALESRQSTQPQAARCPADLLPAVSEKTKQAIMKGEFIDFGTLLPSLSPHNPNMLFELVAPNMHGESVMAIAKQNQRKKITTFQMWLKAWNTYIRCMLQFHAHLISQLLYYQSEITQLALL